MTTNKHTATRTTKTGKSIEVTIERGTWTEEVHLDGSPTGTYKTHAIDRTDIVLRDQSGKRLMSGSKIEMVTPMFYKNYKELIAKGAVARIGDAYITQEIVDLVNDAAAEAEAAAPKTAEQVEIENAKAAAQKAHDDWHNSPEEIAYRKFTREMERADSDY